jgi:hypothetical protein
MTDTTPAAVTGTRSLPGMLAPRLVPVGQGRQRGTRRGFAGRAVTRLRRGLTRRGIRDTFRTIFSVIAAVMAILGGGTMPEALAATVPTASVTATSTATPVSASAGSGSVRTRSNVA